MSIQALAMGADGSIVAGTSRGRVVRWANGSWEALREMKGGIQDVWVSPSGAVWMVGARCERWVGELKKERVKVGDDGFMCVRGMSDLDVWVSGYGPKIAHWDGRSWQEHDTGLENGASDYIAALGGTHDHVCAGGERGIARWDGSVWTTIEESVDTCINGGTTWSDGRAVFAGHSAQPELWFVGRGGFERFVLDEDPLDDDELQCIAMGPNGRLYFTTGRRLLSWLDGELRLELRDEKYDCFGVASNGTSVAAATSKGVWLLEDEWRLIGKP